MTDVITSAPDQFTSVMLGVFPGRPGWARVDTAQEVAFELMKATPEGQRAPMLCLIGWLEWLKGKSSFAARIFKLAGVLSAAGPSVFRSLWASECVQISFYGPLRD
ncbi:hypothetical protein SAMN04487914_1578 [Arthrobacter sp. ok909]|nr:hypothetical protein SAMN04487914_1578 [Arthrobacter sp. ok909]